MRLILKFSFAPFWNPLKKPVKAVFKKNKHKGQSIGKETTVKIWQSWKSDSDES